MNNATFSKFLLFLLLSIGFNINGFSQNLDDCDLTLCVPSFIDSQIPSTICPKFCDLSPDAVVISAHSIFNCAIEYLDGNLCFNYTPLPALPYDTISIIGELGGEYDTLKYAINIGSCEETLAEVPEDEVNIEFDASTRTEINSNDLGFNCQNLRFENLINIPSEDIALVSIREDGKAIEITAVNNYDGEIEFNCSVCETCGECKDLKVMADLKSNLIPGCTDPDACNYNEAATEEDNSCVYEGADCEEGPDTNLEDLKEMGFSMYPNPTKDGIFSIESNNIKKDLTITVYNSLGKEVNRQYFAEVEEPIIPISLEDASTGVYFVQIQVGEEVLTQRLIRE